MKIALDAMGGDFGPPNLVGGAVMALREYPRIEKLFLVGDAPRIEAELKKHGCNDGRDRDRPCDAGRRDDRWRRRSRAAEKRFLRQPRGRSGQERRRRRHCQRRPHRRGRRRDDDQIAHASGRRSPRHRGRDPIGNERLCSDRRRREQRARARSTCCNTPSWARSIRGTCSVTRIRRSA